jgi:hypothetical protein
VHQVPPFVAIVGKERDAVGSAEAFGSTIIENLAFMTGYLGYPCDAVYVTAVFPVMGQLPHEADLPTEFQHKLSAVAWSHCVATSETYTLMMIRNINDDGTETWEQVNPGVEADASCAPLVTAAHDFDREKIADLESISRRNARDLVLRSNGFGYNVTFLPAGESLDQAIFAAVNEGA